MTTGSDRPSSVLAKFVAKTPGVDPNDGIGTAVEVRSLPVQLVGQDRFLERVSLPGQPLLDDEGEKTPQLPGARKDLAREDSLELGEDDGIRQVASFLGACVGFGGHRRSVRTDRSVHRRPRTVHQPVSGR